MSDGSWQDPPRRASLMLAARLGLFGLRLQKHYRQTVHHLAKSSLGRVSVLKPLVSTQFRDKSTSHTIMIHPADSTVFSPLSRLWTLFSRSFFPSLLLTLPLTLNPSSSTHSLQPLQAFRPPLYSGFTSRGKRSKFSPVQFSGAHGYAGSDHRALVSIPIFNT